MYGPVGIALLLEVGAEHGVPAERLLVGSGLTVENLADPRCLVRPQQDIDVARNVIAVLGDRPGFGAAAGSRASLAGSGVAGYALLHSPSWRHALELFTRFQQLVPVLTIPRLVGADDQIEVVLDDSAIPVDVRDLLAERDLAAIAAALRIVGPPTPVIEVHTRLSTDRARHLGLAFDPVPVIPDHPAHVFRLEIALLDAPLPTAAPEVQELCVRECERLLSQADARSGTAARVRHRLLCSPQTMPSLEAVAEEMNLDPRTLRRHLAAQGTTYRALREEVLRTLAVELLTTAGLNVTETADRLGYSNAAAFSQAFARWTGTPPSHIARPSTR
ncbi:MAG: helix-turn-helix domain-containing protein [Sporichthyaceae bacterium]